MRDLRSCRDGGTGSGTASLAVGARRRICAARCVHRCRCCISSESVGRSTGWAATWRLHSWCSRDGRRAGRRAALATCTLRRSGVRLVQHPLCI